MHRFFESKVAFAATLSLFAGVLACTLNQGTPLLTGHALLAANPVIVAHGPMIPPDPWAGGAATKPVTIAHGPMIPPDPWAGGAATRPVTVAHGPMIPPDPWAGGAATV